MKIAVVSSYPKVGAPQSGVAYYAQTLAAGLQASGYDVTALTSAGGWFFYPFAIARTVRRLRPNVALVQHAPFLYGNDPISVVAFPALLILLRLLNVTVVTEVHDIRALGTIDDTFASETTYRLPAYVLRFAYKMLFWSIGRLSHRLIVHDTKSQHILVADYGSNPDRVNVVPLLLQEVEVMERDQARRMLGVPIEARCLVFFGYASNYKGLELLAEALRRLGLDERYREVVALVAAGPNPHLVGRQSYDKYYDGLKSTFEGLRNVRWCGFVADMEVPAYFSAGDVVVLPYTRAIGSSGPLGLALSFGCPALISNMILKDGYEGDITIFEPSIDGLVTALSEFLDTPRSNQSQRRNGDSLRADIMARYRSALSQGSRDSKVV